MYELVISLSLDYDYIGSCLPFILQYTTTESLIENKDWRASETLLWVIIRKLDVIKEQGRIFIAN